MSNDWYANQMKLPKDVVLSTKTFVISHIAILTLGLIFFGGLYYILYQDKFQPTLLKYNPVTREPVSLFLEVSSPEDEIMLTDDSLLISGKTGPDFTVIISDNDTDAGLQSGKDGGFSKVITLDEGANLIEVTAFDLEGNSKTEARTVYYSKEELK